MNGRPSRLRKFGSVPKSSQSSFSGSPGKVYAVVCAARQAPDDDDDDDDEDDDEDVVFVGSPSSGGPPVSRGYGLSQGPVHAGGLSGYGVMPPIIPTSRGMHPPIWPPNNTVQKLSAPQRGSGSSPGGPVTVILGSVGFVGTGTTVEYVGVAVRGAVNSTEVAPGGGRMLYAAIYVIISIFSMWYDCLLDEDTYSTWV